MRAVHQSVLADGTMSGSSGGISRHQARFFRSFGANQPRRRGVLGRRPRCRERHPVAGSPLSSLEKDARRFMHDGLLSSPSVACASHRSSAGITHAKH
jgi:hypothetical protein